MDDEIRFAMFNRFDLSMTLAQAQACSVPGQAADAAVHRLSLEPGIRAQLNAIPAHQLKAELEEYGAWDDLELANMEENRRRILWLAAGDIWEHRDTECNDD